MKISQFTVFCTIILYTIPHSSSEQEKQNVDVDGPSEEEPKIYFTFKRWEDRGYPPRLLYLLMRHEYLKRQAHLQASKVETRGDHDNFLGISTRTGVISPKSQNPKNNAGIKSESLPISFNDQDRPLPYFNRIQSRQNIDGSSNANVFSSTFDLDQSPLSYPEEPSVIDLSVRFNLTPPLPNISPITRSTFGSAKKIINKFTGSGNKDPFLDSDSEESSEKVPEIQREEEQGDDPNVVHQIEEKDQQNFGQKSKFSFVELPSARSEENIRTLDMSLDIMKVNSWQREGQNELFSPFSICNVLALLLLGSSGNSFTELARQLRKDISFDLQPEQNELNFHSNLKKLTQLLQSQSGDKVTLEIANQIFLKKNYPIKNSYVNSALNFYGSPVSKFDFGTDGELFKKIVNKWVREKTKDKIKSIIDVPPPSETTMAFVNAVYFNGAWEIPFPEKITKMDKFTVGQNDQIPMKMMTNIISIPYLSTDKFKMISIPYKSNKTGLFVILPKATNGIKGIREIEESLTAESLRADIYAMQHSTIAVKLPKMRLESTGQMRDILMNLGLKTIFEPNQANFSRISDSPGIYISSLNHRAIIDLNEKGTEAAAVTASLGDRIASDIPTQFYANRPFIFFIFNVKTNTVLFWGRAIRPQALPE